MLSTEISPRYSHLRPFIESLPARMEHEGETIHNGRNLIKVFTAPDGLRLNVKRYHAPHFVNAIVYSTGMRTPKGRRAFDYPALLLKAGIETPEAVAYIEDRRMGLLRESYFISVQCPYPNRFYEVLDMDESQYVPLAEAFASFTARMHKARMMHRDYSPGNILWKRDSDGTFRFSVVDINRMYFGDVSLRRGCANFARMWGCKKFFDTIARTYARERDMDEEKCLTEVWNERMRFWRRYMRKHKVEMPDL